MARALGAELVIVYVAADGMLYGETPFGRAELERVSEAQRAWARREVEARVSAAHAARVLRTASCPVLTVRAGDALARAA
jgi:hypothetical protein